MAQKWMRPAPRERADLGNAKLGSFNSQNTAAALTGQGVVDLQAWRLRRRFGLSDSVAKLLSDHAFGSRPESFDSWVSLADVTVAAFENHVGIGRQG